MTLYSNKMEAAEALTYLDSELDIVYRHEIKLRKDIKALKQVIKDFDWPACGSTYYCAHHEDPTHGYYKSTNKNTTYAKRMVAMGLAFRTAAESNTARYKLLSKNSS